jgi:hypothetical protein
MKNIRDTCIEFFQNEDIHKDVKEMLKPIVQILYNEMYFYILFICIYNVFLIFIVLANLFLLMRLLNKAQSDSVNFYDMIFAPIHQ